jgi:hypothetical protein
MGKKKKKKKQREISKRKRDYVTIEVVCSLFKVLHCSGSRES